MARSVVTRFRDTLVPLTGSAADTAALFASIAEARAISIGEASHGTHEFYRERSEMTKKLIAEHGVTAVCIEGDWPDAYRVNRFVRGATDDEEAVLALGGFLRFPTWMWRNAEVLDFVSWLREYNDSARRTGRDPVGFYGLDLYSMYASIEAVLQYLGNVDPPAQARARDRYACLDPYAERPEEYGVAVAHGLSASCRNDVLVQLREIQQQAARYARHDGIAAEDEYFYAEQNARIVAGAERYYRAMLDDTISTWNLRDIHMVDTLDRLMAHLARHGRKQKAVLWAHNSHIGDARATSMVLRHETNVGALLRDRFGREAASIGMLTYGGTVTAAADWHAPAERKIVRPARTDSYEYFFHEQKVPRFWVPLRAHRPRLEGLPEWARERAIGVVYRPETELQSHYFTANLLGQFDAVLHFDRTRAVEPLERGALWVAGEPPETFPSGE